MTQPTDPPVYRSAQLRVAAGGPETPAPIIQSYNDAAAQIMELADFATARGLTVDLHTTTFTDDGTPDTHPERDALLALADRWAADYDSTDLDVQDLVSRLAGELVRTVATLNL